MPTTNGEFINVATANEYIETFLDDNYDPNDFGKVNVKSFIFDAALMRNYLSDTNITNLKLMMGSRQISGTKYPTIIIAGYDASGNYVKAGTSGNMVLDHGVMCPPNCPISGTAKNDTIS